MIFSVSFAASVPLPVVKFAIWGIVPATGGPAWLNIALALTSVNEPLAVNVCSIVEEFEAAVWFLVVASALDKPLVVISPVKLVFPTAGVIVDSVDATKPAPLVPVEVFVYTCACIQSLPASVSKFGVNTDNTLSGLLLSA